ncbi:hypothetical protein MKEN_00010100 [Mycena kentingensis (nom. inval.)]|nr:hypothetical protein MKEN_00010100 [Mycena kentingensis (nom. inval.)]
MSRRARALDPVYSLNPKSPHPNPSPPSTPKKTVVCDCKYWCDPAAGAERRVSPATRWKHRLRDARIAALAEGEAGLPPPQWGCDVLRYAPYGRPTHVCARV